MATRIFVKAKKNTALSLAYRPDRPALKMDEGVYWPYDQFTSRRITDGSIEICNDKPQVTVKDVAADKALAGFISQR